MALGSHSAMPTWILLTLLVTSSSSSDLHTGLGMVSEKKGEAQTIESNKRSVESEADRQMVTIDLSALRPSLPGLVLYDYGEQAPKLVQIDLSSLNPQLQSHVIWPQFDQMDLGDSRPFELDSADAIPYLSETTPLLAPRPQRFSRLSGAVQPEWPMDDLADGDVYDFIPDSLRNEELMTLHQSLPLADEVIVPLDWEDKTNFDSAATKRNVFVSKGWTPGGHKERESEKQTSEKPVQFTKGRRYQDNVMYTPFGLDSWRPGKRQLGGRETETEGTIETPDAIPNFKVHPGKKNVFISKGWGPGGRSLSTTSSMRGASNPQRGGSKARGRHGRNVNAQPAKISSQESWSVPRRYWTVPHLFGVHFQ